MCSNCDCEKSQEKETEVKLTNKAGLSILESLLKFYDFGNNITVKEVKETIQERLWIEDFEIRFRAFKVIYKGEVIGKVTVAVRKYFNQSNNWTDKQLMEEQVKQALSNCDSGELIFQEPLLKLAFAFCDVDRDNYSRKEGERYSLHRLLCDEPGIITNSKYTKLDNEFAKTVEVSLPFQAFIEDVPGIDHELILIKEAIIKSANSMQILWMSGTRVEDIK